MTLDRLKHDPKQAKSWGGKSKTGNDAKAAQSDVRWQQRRLKIKCKAWMKLWCLSVRSLAAASVTPKKRSFASGRSVSSIAGTAPSYRGHLILNCPTAAQDWPAKVESLYDPLLPALQALAQDATSPLNNYGFAVSPVDSHQEQSSDGRREASIKNATLCLPGTSSLAQTSPDIDFSQPLERLLPQLQSWAADQSKMLRSSHESQSATNHVEVYVCTHNARDCRCGSIGTAFYKSAQQLPSFSILSSGMY